MLAGKLLFGGCCKGWLMNNLRMPKLFINQPLLDVRYIKTD